MPRYPRNYLDTSFFHVMSQGINKSYIFKDEIDIKFYIKNMYEIKDKYSVKIIAYCIMNNHTHILIETKTTENLSKYMHCLNTRYGLYYNKKYKRTGYVFRDRYKAEGIYSEEQLHNCIKYIYDNPVKAEVCNKAEEYEFSNYKKINFTNTREYSFIDIEEDKRVVCNKLVKEFLKVKELKLEELKCNKTELGELVKILKKHNISFRIISNIIKINREKIRREYNKI